MGRARVNATMVNKLLLLIYQNFHLSLPHKQFRHLTKATSWPLFFFVVVALGVFHNRLERTTNSTEEQALRLSICARSVSALSLAAVPCRNKWNNKSKEPWEKMWCHFFCDTVQARWKQDVKRERYYGTAFCMRSSREWPKMTTFGMQKQLNVWSAQRRRDCLCEKMLCVSDESRLLSL